MRGKISQFVLVIAVAMILVGSVAQSASAYHPVGWFLGITRGPAVCGSPCDGGWYVGVRPGPVRRFLFGPYRYYPGYSSYGYCAPTVCCDICNCDPCCCTSIASTTVKATTPTIAPKTETSGDTTKPTPALKKIETEPAPIETTPVAPDPDPITIPENGSDFTPVYPPVSGISPLNQSATITLNVPADSKVFINDYETSSTGPTRQFVSHNLMPGYDYQYDIRVEIVREGQLLEAKRNVVLRSGQTYAIALRHNDMPVSDLAQVD